MFCIKKHAGVVSGEAWLGLAVSQNAYIDLREIIRGQPMRTFTSVDVAKKFIEKHPKICSRAVVCEICVTGQSKIEFVEIE